jgi:A/G-specific adenine glycosylase
LPDSGHQDFNQAMMEFGAIQCRPNKPDCQLCPLADICVAFKQNMVGAIPFKSKSKAARIRHFNYLVIEYDNRWLLTKRSQNDIWKYLYEFLLIETPALHRILISWYYLNTYQKIRIGGF